MRLPPRPLLLLHPDPALHRLLRGLPGRAFSVHAVPDWEALERAVRDAPPSVVAIVDPARGAEHGEFPADPLRRLLEAFPSVPVFAVVDGGEQTPVALRTLGAWGVAQVVTAAHDDTIAALLHRLDAAQGRSLRRGLAATLPPDTSGRARAIADTAAAVVAVGGQGRELARRLSLSRRTLLRWCDRAGLPPPRKLLAWLRVMLAAEMLDDPGRTVLAVAHACGYASDSGLRRVTRRFVGSSPAALRRVGAARRCTERFGEVVSRSRERAGRRPPAAPFSGGLRTQP
jgi:AraC-like DNA-binding protein